MLGKELKGIRLRLGLTRKVMAMHLGISPRTLEGLEQGRTITSSIERLALYVSDMVKHPIAREQKSYLEYDLEYDLEYEEEERKEREAQAE